jgi:hypothetical protein
MGKRHKYFKIRGNYVYAVRYVIYINIIKVFIYLVRYCYLRSRTYFVYILSSSRFYFSSSTLDFIAFQVTGVFLILYFLFNMDFILYTSYFSPDKHYTVEMGLLSTKAFEPYIRLRSSNTESILLFGEFCWCELITVHGTCIKQFLDGEGEIPEFYQILTSEDMRSKVIGNFRLGEYTWQFKEGDPHMLNVRYDECNQLFLSPFQRSLSPQSQGISFNITIDLWMFINEIKDSVLLRLSYLNSYKFIAKKYYSRLVNYAIKHDVRWSQLLNIVPLLLPNGPMPRIAAANELELNTHTMIQAEILHLPLAQHFNRDVRVARRNRQYASINRSVTELSDHFYFSTHWWYFDLLTVDDKRFLFFEA